MGNNAWALMKVAHLSTCLLGCPFVLPADAWLLHWQFHELPSAQPQSWLWNERAIAKLQQQNESLPRAGEHQRWTAHANTCTSLMHVQLVCVCVCKELKTNNFFVCMCRLQIVYHSEWQAAEGNVIHQAENIQLWYCMPHLIGHTTHSSISYDWLANKLCGHALQTCKH